jgi:quinolinate synthase
MKEEILKLKKEKKAVILAHNYQIPEIQEVADFVGDSFELARKAREVDSKIIVFCGVIFMVEMAKILNPDKKVLTPNISARCPMADMVSPEDVLKLKEENPDAIVVSYVNTNADVKALSDICCTSSNALKVVKSINSKKIIFLPDENLANYVSRFTDKKIIPFNGFCYVHKRFNYEEVKRAKEIHPDAYLLVHPECNPEIIDIADEVASTSGMIRIAKNSNKNKFLIATEEGLIQRLRREVKGKEFYSAGSPKICYNMKKIRLEDVYNSLLYEKEEIFIDEKIIERAKKPLEKMLEVI